MSSVQRVPETAASRECPGAEDAWIAFRRYGTWPLARDSYVRFRYGDGFTSARALALQVCLAFVPFVLALVGLADVLGRTTSAQVLRLTLLELTPGTRSDEVVRQTIDNVHRTATGDGGTVALVGGVLAALVSLVTAVGQVERGANRLYGVQRDRPCLRKYLLATGSALAAGLPAVLAVALLVAGTPVGRALVAAGVWSEGQRTAWEVARWPVGVLLAVACFTFLFRVAPRRRQPGWSWLGLGGGLAVALWLGLTALLGVYLSAGDVLGSTYGPLTAVIALLLWALLSSVALFLGLAVAAQLEAANAGVEAPALPDPEAPAAQRAVPARPTVPVPR